MGTYTAKCDICHAENEVPNYGDWACSQCGQRYEYDEGHRILLTDAQLQTLRSRWIPVSERLPEDDQQCLTVDKNGVQRVARFDAIGDGERHSWYEEQEWKSVYPVAWMPLPEPPEVK
jgi:hypothetical protein